MWLKTHGMEVGRVAPTQNFLTFLGERMFVYITPTATMRNYGLFFVFIQDFFFVWKKGKKKHKKET